MTIMTQPSIHTSRFPNAATNLTPEDAMGEVTKRLGQSRKSYDVVVIGGGITGANAAFWLARRGLTVCLLERRALASVQSGHSAGMVGSHRATALKLDLAARAMR